jgi:predicted RNase H-like HicB family nuclease
MQYRVLIEPDEDGVYVAEVPSLPGCISQGHTRAEALKNVKEVIAAYLESLKAHNEPVPPPISDIALGEAIREGRQTEYVDREEVIRLCMREL